MAMVAGEALMIANRHRRPLAVIGGVTAAVLFAGGLGFVHAIRNSVETEIGITGGVGTVTKVYAMDKSCHGGYEADIKGAKAEKDHKISFFGRDIPTSYTASETFNGKVKNEVCDTGIDGKQIIDTKNHHITVNIPPKSLSSTVYTSNPADPNMWTYHNGLVMAVMNDFVNKVDAMPGGITIPGNDRLRSKLQGWALLGAYATSSQACGEKAWPDLKPTYDKGVKQKIVADANTYGALTPGFKPYTEADITVNTPETVKLTNQYDGQLQAIESNLAANGATITKLDPNALVCHPMAASPNGGAQ